MIKFQTKSGWSVSATERNDIFLIEAIHRGNGSEYMLNTTSSDNNQMYLARGGIHLTEYEEKYLNDQLRDASQRG